MFEYRIDKDGTISKLNTEQESRVISHISQSFTKWDTLRNDQKDRYRDLKPELYLEKEAKKDTWKSNKRMNKIYSLFQTRQAFLWENIYADINKMFDVDVAGIGDEQIAKAQKSMLVEAFENMGLSQNLDKAMEHLDSVGEMCLFTCWKSRTKQVREKQEYIGIDGSINTQTVVVDKVVYDGAYVDTINPLNLVFDPSVNPDIKPDWDSCGKIIKTFQTYDSIAKNKAYSLTKEQLRKIKDTVSMDNMADDDDTDNDVIDKIDDITDGDKIEVLEYWGDFYVDDKLLKNWTVAVIGREHLARFMANPFIINPIINVATLRNPDNQRGIQTLYSIYDLSKAQEDDINETKDVQQLNKNPARFAPDNFFKDDEIEISPGKIIKYKQGLDDPSAIIPIVVPLIDANSQISYLDNAISNVSGIFPNMQGQEEGSNTTATEIKVKVQGQTARLSKDLDTIKQNGILRMIENVADLIANENLGQIQNIIVNENGVKRQVVVDDTVRQGDYQYRYSDNTANASKRQQFQEVIGLIEKLAGAGVPFNFMEIAKMGFGLIGIENTDKLFMEQNNGQGINQEGINGIEVGAGANNNPPLPEIY